MIRPLRALWILPIEFIYRRIQRGVVIHFELSIKLESALSQERLLPQAVEAAGKVAALILENFEPLTVSLSMAFRGVGPLHFLDGMKDLQSKNRKPVNDESGRLRMQLGVEIRQIERAQVIEQNHIAALGEIIAALVDSINGPFYFRKIVVSSLRGAGLIFRMPQFEIGQMLRDDSVQKFSIIFSGHGRLLLVPERGQAVVLLHDFFGGENRCVRKSHSRKKKELW